MASQRPPKQSKIKTQRRRSKAAADVPDDDWPPPSAATIRELRRRVKDIDDRVRYLLVSAFTPTFLLYYNVSEDTFAMSEPASATLFKRRSAASAIQKLLGRGVQIVPCRVDRGGTLVASSLPARFRARRRRRSSR